MEHPKQANFVTIVVSAFLVIVVGVLIFLFVRARLPLPGYYAVFLDNDQVYFGKIADKDAKYVELAFRGDVCGISKNSKFNIHRS